MMRARTWWLIVVALFALSAPRPNAAEDPAAQEPAAKDSTAYDSEIHALIETLDKGKEPSARAEAAKRLQELGHHAPAQKALPVLRRVTLVDPDASVRAAAVQALAQVAFNSQPRLCPVEVFKAWSDENEEVRDWAMAYANLFLLIDSDDPQERSVAHLEPGCEALLLEQMASKNSSSRESALFFLALAPKPGDAAREAVLAARHDEHFNVRNSAHIVWFRMTDKLADIFPYYVRAMEELLPPELSDEELKKLSEQENSERCQKHLILLGIPIRFVDLASQRQEEAAAAMKVLLRDKSADTRRQTAVFVGKFGWMVGEKLPTPATPFSPFSGEGESGSDTWLQHLLPYIEQGDSQSFFRTPSADYPSESIKRYIPPADNGASQSKEAPRAEDESKPSEEATDKPQQEPMELPKHEPRMPTLDWLTKHGLLDELRKMEESDDVTDVRQAASEALKRIEERRKTPLEDGRGRPQR